MWQAIFSIIMFFSWGSAEHSEDMEKNIFLLWIIELVDGYFVTDRYLGFIAPFTTCDDRVLGQTWSDEFHFLFWLLRLRSCFYIHIDG